MPKRSLRTLLGLVGLVVLTFNALGAASFAPSVGSASVAADAVQSITSGTPRAHVTISTNRGASKAGTSTFGTSIALAARTLASPPGPTPKGYYPDHCLEVFIFSLNAVNTNQADLSGEIYNNCAFTVTSGTIDVSDYVQSCGGVTRTGSSSVPFYNLYPGSTTGYQDLATGECELCQNHVAVEWPPFTLVVQVDAEGTGLSNQLVEDTGSKEESIPLPNSKAYSFPC